MELILMYSFELFSLVSAGLLNLQLMGQIQPMELLYLACHTAWPGEVASNRTVIRRRVSKVSRRVSKSHSPWPQAPSMCPVLEPELELPPWHRSCKGAGATAMCSSPEPKLLPLPPHAPVQSWCWRWSCHVLHSRVRATTACCSLGPQSSPWSGSSPRHKASLTPLG